MARVLLIVPGATYRAAAFLEAATRLGVEVVIGSDEAQALVEVMGDHFLELPLGRPERAGEAIAALGARLPLDAVLSVDDQGALAAAFGAAALRLGQNPPSAVAATRDKAAMRAAFARAGVAQPDYVVIDAQPTGRAAAVQGAAGRIGYPCVLKPTSLSASRGVIRVDDDDQARRALARIEAILAEVGQPASAVLVERFIPGQEVALEGMLSDGKLQVLAIFDKPDPLDGPYFEETIYVTPSRHPAATQEAVADTVQRACAALGLRQGPVHAEARLPPAGTVGLAVVMLEVAARTIGGRCAAALSFSSGHSLEELVLAHAVGRVLDGGERRDPDGCAVMMLPIASSGTLRGIEHQAEARAVEFITALEVTVPLGRTVRAAPESDRYLGFLFARAPTPELAEAALRAADAALRVRIEPDVDARDAMVDA